MLRLVDGRVPLVLEFKGRKPLADEGFTKAVLATLEGYKGPVALMAFEHHILRELKTLRLHSHWV
jgi:glycerophosphoryl diester phosphodiesterase